MKLLRILIMCLFLITLNSIFALSQNLGKGLIGYWRFDGNATDEINSKKLRINGNPEIKIGKYGLCYKLNGKTDYFNILPSDTTNLYYNSNGYSWSIWFKSDSLPSDTKTGLGPVLVSAKDDINGEDIYLGFGSLFKPKRSLIFQVDDLGGYAGIMKFIPEYYPINGFLPDKWYNVTGVNNSDNDSVYLYLDGVLVAKGKTGGSPIKRDMYFNIGANFTGLIPSEFFKGLIDELRIYNRALLPDEVLALSSIDSVLYIRNNTIDFGDISCVNNKILDINIINKSSLNQSILGGELANGTNFTITSIDTNSINPNDSIKIKIKFQPSGYGIFYDTLTILNKDYLPPTIVFLRGEKHIKDYSIIGTNNDTLDFGIICYNLVKDTNFTINVKSTSKIKLFADIDSPFNFLDSSLTKNYRLLDSNEVVNIKLSVNSFSNDTILLGKLNIYDECNNKKTIYLKAEFNVPNFQITGNIDTVICPNEDAKFSFYIKNLKPVNLYLNVFGDNYLFDFNKKIIIQPNENYKFEVIYNSFSNQNQQLNLTFFANCTAAINKSINITIPNLQVTSDADTLDFGDVILCNNGFIRTKSFNLTNNKINSRINVKSINISNNFISDLKVGDFINANQTKQINITPKTNSAGQLFGFIDIIFDTCNLTKTIYFKANIKDINISSIKNINFGKRIDSTGSNYDTTFYYLNNNDFDLTIKNISINSDTFNIIEPSNFPYNLKSKDSIRVKIKYNPKLGINLAKLMMTINTDCGDTTISSNLSGEGVYQAEITLKINDILNAEIGKISNVEIVLVKANNLIESGVKEIYANLSINPKVMMPLDTNFKSFTDGDRLIFPVEINIEKAKEQSIIKQIPFKIALGNAESDSITFYFITAINSFAKINTNSGALVIKDICKAGGTRLFDYSGNMGINFIKPNPVSGIFSIEFELIEKGLTKLYLVNIEGKIEKYIFNEIKEIGKYILYFNSNILPQGDYFIVLETPTNLLSNKIKILR